MPKLRPIDFHFNAENDDHYRFQAPVYIDTDGRFRVLVDPDLLEEVMARVRAPEHNPGQRLKVEDVYKNRERSHWLFGPTLAECKSLLEACIKVHMQCEKRVERVIRYAVKLDVSYFKTKDGRIVTTNEPGSTHYGRRYSSAYTDMPEAYAVGVAAEVFDKTTYIRGTGTKVDYKSVHAPDLQWLSALNHLSMRVDENQTVQDMPYTEDAAKFFYELLVQVCALGDRLRVFFEDKRLVQQAINSHTPLLIAASDASRGKG